MPFPPALTAPYDSLETVLNTARVRLNDAIQQLGGDILKNSQPFTQQMANSAWRRLQEYLANFGHTRGIDEYTITGLPPVATLDPASQCWLDWTGYFDGTQIWTGFALPRQFYSPLKLWERVTGQDGYFAPMNCRMDGLPDGPKGWRNGFFEWRNDRLYMPGSQNSMDLRIRFAQFFPDFATQGETQWYQQPVPIARCLDAFADYICVEACDGRDDVDSQTFKDRAEKEAKLIFNRDVRLKQRSNVRRHPRSGPRNAYAFGDYGY